MMGNDCGCMHAGGVFEEALAEATFFLEPGSPIAQTVRNADIIDNVWTSGGLSAQARPSTACSSMLNNSDFPLCHSRTHAAASVNMCSDRLRFS